MQDANDHFIDLTVFDDKRAKIGTVTDVLVDPENLEPQYLTVRTGVFDPLAGEHILPVVVVERRGDQLTVPFDRQLVKSAPRTRDHTPLTSQEQQQVSLHYGVA